ncbi:hypothetical protein [Archangium lipolyticum]|uniref:hypothetical protein n=1 Tax=Archangium lipolyticum TaxID=2970465 RepID=UPI002149EF13|nr:hypothetical protein [Archangium lipolyticum]
MNKSIAPLVSLLFLCASTAMAQQSPVDVTTYGTGGIRYTVNSSGFETPFPYGQKTDAAYTLPYDSAYRPGCLALSPQLPIGHAAGYAQYIPVMTVTWSGPLNDQNQYQVNLGQVMAVVTKVDGTQETYSALFGTQHMPNRFLLYEDPILGRIFWGQIENSLTAKTVPVMLQFEVEEQDFVQISVCNLMPNTGLTLRKLVLQSWPYEGAWFGSNP